MLQGTPTPAKSGGGITPSRLGGVGSASGGGGGVGGGGGPGGGGTGVDSRPWELMKACFVAVTTEEKMCLANQGADSSGGGSGGGGDGICAMTMATPTPRRGGGGLTPFRGGGPGVLGGGSGAGVVGGGLGLLGRVEDGLTTFLVLAMGILR